MAALVGVLFAALSAFFNGSFGVLSKVESVQRAKVSSLHFNFWVAVGLIVSTLPLLAFSQVFTPWGMLSGAFFVASTGCTFFAIDKLGISVASAIWCGTAMLASFIWGLRVNNEELSSPGFSIPALLLLIGGLAGIAFNGRFSEVIREIREKEEEAEDREAREQRMEEERILDPYGQHQEVAQRGPESYGIGCVAAVAAGLFGGLLLAPKTFADQSIHAIAYLPSMALDVTALACHAGVLVAAPLLTFGVGRLSSARELPDWQCMRTGALWGIAAGIIWNLGNVLSMLATERVGIAIAYPIFQCGLLVAGVYGILVFNEIERPCIPAYLLSGLALVAGATFLALAK